MKLINPDYGRMYEVVGAGFKKSLSKALLSVFLFLILKTVLMYYVVKPFVPAAQPSENVSLIYALLPALCLFAVSGVFTEILDYGLVSYITDLIIKKQAPLTEVVRGFSKGRVWLFSVVHSLISCIAVVISTVVFLFYVQKMVLEAVPADGEDAGKILMLSSLLAFFVIYGVFYFVLKTPFIFTWNLLKEDPSAPVLKTFVRSFSLVVPRFFHFAGFVIYITYKNVLVYIVLLLIANFIPLGIFGLAVSFLLFVQMLTIILKVYASYPVYFYSLLSVNGLIRNRMQAESGDGTDESSS